MNVSMEGLVYIAAWSFADCALSGARAPRHGLACVAMLLYALAGVGGTLTLVETIGCCYRRGYHGVNG
jgi:hypothetical protein